MKIQLWGVRGSLPAPLTNEEYHHKIISILKNSIKYGLKDESEIEKFVKTQKDNLQYLYGGNTTCISVQSNSGKQYIIDAGTGIRPLGYDLMNKDCGRGKGKVDIFLTHNHWDHIQGLPFFSPIYIPGNEIHIHSPYKNQEEILANQMKAPFFPATFEETPSDKFYHFLDIQDNSPLQLEEDLTCEKFKLKHPNGSFAYKFKQNNKTFIFATDAEFTGEILETENDEFTFFNEADLLIMDAQYTLDESFLKIDWGHTSYTMSVNCGIRWKAKKLVLTHHEPAYSDNKLLDNYEKALEHGEFSNNKNTEIFMAREGMIFEV